MRQPRALLLLAWVTASMPLGAAAEVSDKMPSVIEHWIRALVVAVVLFVIPRFRWWLGLPLTVVPIAALVATIQLPTEPDAGAAVLRERGWTYVAHLLACDGLLFGALSLGVRAGWRRARPVPAST